VKEFWKSVNRHIWISVIWITVKQCRPIASFLPRDALVHSAVLRLHVVRLSVCPSVRLSVRLSVCDVGGSGSHRLEILETNCTDT